MKIVVLFEKRRDKWATAVAVRRVLLSFLCSFDGNKSMLMCASFLYINHSHNIELVQQTYRAHSSEAWELAELQPLCRKEIIETALLSNGCCSSMGPSSVSRRSVRDGVVNGRRFRAWSVPLNCPPATAGLDAGTATSEKPSRRR